MFFFSSDHLFLAFLVWVSHEISISSCSDRTSLMNPCKEQCGSIPIRYPFYLSNCSCGFDGFKLHCLRNSTLTLTLNNQTYGVLSITTDSLLIDFFPSSSCPVALNDFSFKGNQLYGISIDNILQLSKCVNFSLCERACDMPLCAEKNGCCYNLSSLSAWRPGDELSVFSAFGCEGFSSWTFDSYKNRGIKLEWAVPQSNLDGICQPEAALVNATTVNGVRCRCETGFLGDGFTKGVGCMKLCNKHRKSYGIECHSGNKQTIILAGVLASASLTIVLVVLHGLLGESLRRRRWDSDSSELMKISSLQKNLSIRLFSFEELEQATKGFTDKGRVLSFDNSFVYAGVIDDESPVAVEKIQYGNKKELSLLLKKINILATISHINLLKFIGCATDSSRSALFMVYEFFVNGSLEDYLQQNDNFRLDWSNRVCIAAGIAKALSYLRFEISPAVYHHNLTSANVFIDHDGAPKVSLLCSNLSLTVQQNRNETYNFGMMLLEIITGSKPIHDTMSLSSKVEEDDLEDIVDPLLLSYQEQLNLKLVKRVAILGLRCVSESKGRSRPSMLAIKEELDRIRYCSTESLARTSLHETFSNSSLLQMVSISPDSSFLSSLAFNNSSSAEQISDTT